MASTVSVLATYFLIGKLSIFFLQKFPLSKFTKSSFLLELFECDLCLGFWVFTALAIVMRVNFVDWYIPALTEVFVGMLSSFVFWLLSAGWHDKFGNYVVEMVSK